MITKYQTPENGRFVRSLSISTERLARLLMVLKRKRISTNQSITKLVTLAIDGYCSKYPDFSERESLAILIIMGFVSPDIMSTTELNELLKSVNAKIDRFDELSALRRPLAATSSKVQLQQMNPDYVPPSVPVISPEDSQQIVDQVMSMLAGVNSATSPELKPGT